MRAQRAAGDQGSRDGAGGRGQTVEETADGWLSCHPANQILSLGFLSSFALNHQEVSVQRNEHPDVGRQQCCEEGVAVSGYPWRRGGCSTDVSDVRRGAQLISKRLECGPAGGSGWWWTQCTGVSAGLRSGV